MLPLLYKKGLVSDARVRSLPVFPAGGPLADTAEQEVALVRAACDSARGDASALAVISPVDYSAALPDFVTDSLPPRWVLGISGDLDELRAGWRKTSNNLFRSLKKADKAGFEFREGTDPQGPGAVLPALPPHDAQAPHAAAPAAAAGADTGHACAGRVPPVRRRA